jgi:hypothetical protein
MAAEPVRRSRWQERFDPLPEGIGDTPSVVVDRFTRGLRGGLSRGHGWISWGDDELQKVLRTKLLG